MVVYVTMAQCIVVYVTMTLALKIHERIDEKLHFKEVKDVIVPGMFSLKLPSF